MSNIQKLNFNDSSSLVQNDFHFEQENKRIHVPKKQIIENVGKPINSIANNMNFSKLFTKVQKYVETQNTKLSLSYDNENKTPIIYVIDKDTNEVIRRIPPEKLVKMSKDPESFKGLIFQKEV